MTKKEKILDEIMKIIRDIETAGRLQGKLECLEHHGLAPTLNYDMYKKMLSEDLEIGEKKVFEKIDVLLNG